MSAKRRLEGRLAEGGAVVEVASKDLARALRAWDRQRAMRPMAVRADEVERLRARVAELEGAMPQTKDGVLVRRGDRVFCALTDTRTGVNAVEELRCGAVEMMARYGTTALHIGVSECYSTRDQAEKTRGLGEGGEA